MLRLVVFTKDRPLQFMGCLKSILHHIPNGLDKIYVITPSFDLFNEEDKRFILEHCEVLEEQVYGNFHLCLNKFLTDYRDFPHNNEDKFILSCCDDCIYIRSPDVYAACSFFHGNQFLVGFSLRLGNNIKPPEGLKIHKTTWMGKNIKLWDFRYPIFGHFTYPFDLMASIYRLDTYSNCCLTKSALKTPNYLESNGCHVLYNQYNNPNFPAALACFDADNYLVAADQNRVQSDFPNKFTGTEEQSPENLLKLYRLGYRLDWKNLDGISPPDVFVGNTYFKLIPPK